MVGSVGEAQSQQHPHDDDDDGGALCMPIVDMDWPPDKTAGLEL
jgi:hypothetical protein